MLTNLLFFLAETEGSLDVTVVIEESINKTMISVDKFASTGKTHGLAPSKVIRKDVFQVMSRFMKFLVSLDCLADTTEVHSETETSVNITEIEDFINKTIIIPEQVVPSGKEDSHHLYCV